MLEYLLPPLVTVLLAVLGFFLKEQWSTLKDLAKQLSEIKRNTMDREQVVAHVEKEILKLKEEIKEDHRAVMEAVNKLDAKIDSLMKYLLENKP